MKAIAAAVLIVLASLAGAAPADAAKHHTPQPMWDGN